MTTKKQKREIAEQKRAAFEAQVKADGLDALKRDRERNEVDKARWREAGRKENERLKAILATEMIHEAQPFQERGPRYDNVTYDELAKFEGQTIPLMYENGGEVIGSGTARMTERGLEFDMFLERGKMPGIFQDSFSDVGISMSPRYSLPPKVEDKGENWVKAIKSEDLTITMPDVISFSPRVQHVLDPNRPLDDGDDQAQWDFENLNVVVDEHFRKLKAGFDSELDRVIREDLDDWYTDEMRLIDRNIENRPDNDE